MTGRRDPKGPNYVDLPPGFLGKIPAPVPAECCARCRRGVKGFGELPCGYLGECPNPKCAHHGAATRARETNR